MLEKTETKTIKTKHKLQKTYVWQNPICVVTNQPFYINTILELQTIPGTNVVAES